MITSVELAKIAGVSQSTVSRCLNDSPLVSEATKKRILKLSEEYDFQLNSNARNLKTNRTDAIGYVFPTNFESFSTHAMQGYAFSEMHKAFSKHMLELVPIYNDSVVGKTNALEHAIRNHKVDGLVVSRDNLPEDIYSMIKKSNIPCIFIHDAEISAPYPHIISTDFMYAGRQVANLFIDRGYKDIFTIMGSLDMTSTMQKHMGFTEILQAAGIELTSEDILYGDYTRDSGYKAACSHINRFRHGSVCFAQNDMMALGVLAALQEYHIKVPDDVAIIGYDDLPMGTWFSPKLSTISINYKEIIPKAVEWMLELLKNPQTDYGVIHKQRVRGEIILRETFV